MTRFNGNQPRRAVAVALAMSFLFAATVSANPPAPLNDDPANAELIGPALPTIVYGTTVMANDSINNTGLAGVTGYDDGPDVFYRFTPSVTGTYRLQLMPWQHAPLRSSDRRFAIYFFEDFGGGSYNFITGVRAPGSARSVKLDAVLTAGVEYKIGIDHDLSSYGRDNFPFTFILDALNLTNPDNCGSAITLPSTLPVTVLNDIDGALDDYWFYQGDGRCTVSGTTPTLADGIDHVYKFTPSTSGEYAIELIGIGFPAVLYIDHTCAPNFMDSCLGASNHSTSGSSGGKHELVVVTLEAGVEYWVYVDNHSTSYNSGSYALIIDDAYNYEINEFEDAVLPSPIGPTLNGGQIVGPFDEDWWSLSGQVGDRVYAWVNNGGSSNSTLDTDMAFVGPDGWTVIEFDDEDGDGADSPIQDLRYIYSTTSAVIAGARMTATGEHFLHITKQYATGTVSRYRLHVGIEPATRAPLQEVEPNDTLALADFTGKHYYAGVVDATDDYDFFSFVATIGDRVFIALDGDPERDASGFDPANTDPNAFHAKLVVYDPAGDVLISDISDSNSIQSGPDYPAQGGFFVARSTGRHSVEVRSQGSSSQVGPTETYELAIFLNDAAPAMTDENDPVVTLTPDFANNRIAGLATDDAPGDSGVCEVYLYGDTNLQITNLTPTPAGTVTFDIELINPADSGFGKLVVADCQGSTWVGVARIDVYPPFCEGFNFSGRTPRSLHGPIHVRDNEPNGPGINGTIEISEVGTITDVNVTITIETIRPPDIDCWLVSPWGTRVELITDRGSSLEFDITEATFDDDAEVIMPILSSYAPYTGTWKPEDPMGLARLNGEDANGIWQLNVVDDSSSASGGARLVSWSLDVAASFSAPEAFAGTASDAQGFDSGIASIELTGASNLQIELPPEFTPGDLVVEYAVMLIDPSMAGSGTVVVSDLGDNTCQSPVSLQGAVDTTNPSNAGEVTTDRKYAREVLQTVIPNDPNGVSSFVSLTESMLVGEVEVDLSIDTKAIGRVCATLYHADRRAELLNRTGMTDRFSVGRTKDNIEITLDDDAPAADDAHLEPALGSLMFSGLHQPDGRGEWQFNAISTDNRDNMLFDLAGTDSTGDWTINVADMRPGFNSSSDTAFRRWSMTIKNPCAAQQYVGRAIDIYPGTGICSINVAAGGVNLFVNATFTPGDEVVDYVVSLIDSSLPGSGVLEIADCAGNIESLPINLIEAGGDQNLPIVSGSVNQAAYQFEGTATDDQLGDSGIYNMEMGPYADNLQFVSVIPDPPNGAGSVDFVVGLINPAVNGRGYVRVTDGCGLRGYALVEIDAAAPVCTGSVENTKRYVSLDLPQAIPQNNPTGVVSTIVVSDTDIVEDANITFNITHPNATDIDMTLLGPISIDLFSDRGSTGNDFIDVTLDDEAAEVIPSSSSAAPFTGSWQPENGFLSMLDGVSAARTYMLKVADDYNNYSGVFDNWALTLESSTFPERYDGRAEDAGPYSTGLYDIVLLPGAVNLTLVVDPFTVGDKIVRYSAELTDPQGYGQGIIEVTDLVGNVCQQAVLLGCSPGDFNGDGVVDINDVGPFVQALLAGVVDCRADLNMDGGVDGLDVQPFVDVLLP